MRVLIAVDDASTSAAIIDFVGDHGMYCGASFRVIHVMNPIMVNEHPAIAYPPFLEPATNQCAIEAREMIEVAAKRLHDKVGRHALINADVLVGLPTTIIVEQARKWPADLIIIGSHGRSGFKQFLLGSVSREVVAKAPCSVLVVRLEQDHRPQFEPKMSSNSSVAV